MKRAARVSKRPISQVCDKVLDCLHASKRPMNVSSVAIKTNLCINEVVLAGRALKEQGRATFEQMRLSLPSVPHPDNTVSCREFNQARDEENRHDYGL